MPMEPSEVKELIATFRELRMSRMNYGRFGNVSKEVVEETKRVKRLIGNPNEEDGAKGSKLVAAGIALIAFPDPTISDLIGAGLVAAGLIQKRMKRTTVVDVYKEFQDAIKNVKI